MDNYQANSKTRSYAESELQLLCAEADASSDPTNRPLIEPFIPEILALVNVFGNLGQSGGEAPIRAGALAGAVHSLCLGKPILPMTGKDNEWFEVAQNVWQNTRCSALFKTSPDNASAYYLDAIVWRVREDDGWSGCAYKKDGSKVAGRQYVKSFPFTPKTFIIEVDEKEVAKDDFDFYIRDESKLDEVFEYYNFFQI